MNTNKNKTPKKYTLLYSTPGNKVTCNIAIKINMNTSMQFIFNPFTPTDQFRSIQHTDWKSPLR